MPTNYPEGTKAFYLSPGNIQALWEMFNKIPGILDDYAKENYEAFITKLFDKDSIWFECTGFPGVLYANGIRTGLSAHVHFVFFDSKLRGRELFLINVLKWLVNMLQLEKVNAFVPKFCKSLISFLKRLGFREEGEVRNWSRNGGKLFNVVILGMTKEEVLNGGVFSAADVGVTGDKAEFVVEQQLPETADVGAEFPEG
jgi:RimJ/RimL family protein N-acetyltransferase